MLINEMKKDNLFKIVLRERRNGKILLDLMQEVRNIAACGSAWNL